MPNIIDNRVVEMQFNNKQFEQGVSTSMGTLEKLKNALNFSSSVSNFGEVTKAFSRFGDSTLNEVAINVQSLSDRFSTWGIVGMQVIQDLTSKATEFVSQALKPITDELGKIDVLTNYTQGWTKYADKTTAVQTIMSATTSTWEEDAKAMGEAGTQMEYVSGALDKLNWFSDETSYSFTDMTSNIGKFTAQGVPLSQAVEAMEGISVWAAKSGQSTNEASRAMYNLSQALGVGFVKLLDWRSIENANMGTLEFKNTVIDTALEVGTLTKTIDSDGNTIYKTLNGMTVGAENFSQTLSEGWFTKDVLLSTLSKYGNATTLLADVSEDYNVTASQFLQSLDNVTNGFSTMEKASEDLGIPLEDLTKIIDTLQSEEYKLGLASFRMAQEAKTFSEAMDATADATSTAWLNVFETIFGNYEEAKVLWTRLANDLYDIFAEPVNVLGEALGEWKDLNGRDMLFDGIHKAWVELSDIGPTVSNALVTSGAFKSSTEWGEAFAHSTAQFKTGIDIFFKYKWDKVLETIDSISHVFGAAVVVGKEFYSVTTDAFKGLFKFDWNSFEPEKVFGPIEKSLYEIRTMIQDELGPMLSGTIRPAVLRISSIVQGILTIVGKLFDRLAPLFGAVLDFFSSLNSTIDIDIFYILYKNILIFIGSITRLIEQLTSDSGISKLEVIAKGIGLVFGNILGLGIDAINLVITGLKDLVNIVGRLFNKIDAESLEIVFNRLGSFRSLFNRILKPALRGITRLVESIGNLLVEIVNSGALSKILDFIYDIAGAASDKLGSGLEGFFNLLASGIDKITAFIPTAVTFLDKHLPKFKDAFQSIFDGFGSIGTSITNIIKNLFGLFDSGETDKASLFSKVIGWIATALDWVGKVMQNIGPIISNVIGWLFTAIKNIGPTVVNILHKIGEGFKYVVEKVKELLGGGGSGFSLESLFKILQGGALSAILFEIFKMFKSGAKGAGGIVELINGLKDGLGGLTKEADGPDIKGIALSVLMLAASCVLLSAIDPKKLVSVLSGLTGALAGLAGAFALMNNFTTTTDPKKGVLSNFLDSLSTKNNRNSSGSLLIKMAAALLIVAGALKILSSMNWDQIGVGLTAMAGCLALMVAALLVMELAPNSKKSGAGLMTAALGMIALALAMKVFGSMNTEQISNGLKAFLGSLLLLTAALVILGAVGPATLAGAGALLVGAAAMVVMAGALLAFGVVLGLLSILKWDKIAENLAPLAGIMLAIIGIGALMGVASPLILLGALGVAALGAALIALGKGLLVYSVALVVLDKLSGGLGALAGSLAILAGLSLVLAIVSPLFLVAAVGMLAFGAALQTLGIGLLIFSAAMAGFGLSLDVIMASIKIILLGMISLVPSLFAALAEGIVQMFVVIANNASLIAETLITIATAILSKLGELVPLIVDLVLNLVVQLLEKLKEVVPLFLELVFDTLTQLVYGLADFAADVVVALLQLLTDTLTALAEFVPQIVEQSVKIALGFIEGFLKGLADGIPGVIQAAWDLVISFVDGIADGIDNNWDRLMEAFRHLGRSLINAILGIFISKETRDEMAASGGSIIDRFREGIAAGFAKVKEIVSDLIRKIVGWFGERWDDIKSIGSNLIEGLKSGIVGKAEELANKAREVVSNAVQKVKNFLGIHSPSRVFAEIGEFSILGLAEGLSDNTKLATDSAEDVGINVSNALSQALQNASASVEDVSPVITPIVDMSNVNDSSKLIAGMFGDTASGMIGLSGSARLAALSSMNAEQLGAYPANSAYNVGAINFTINPQPGQNPEEIADEVMNRLNTTLLRGKAAWA